MTAEREPAPIRTLSSREIYRAPWMTLREDEIEYLDGSAGRYAVMDKPDFAMVLPYQDDGFWLVQEYRYPVGRRMWNFCQGGWPAGHDGTPAELAAAELREETGLRAEQLIRLGRLHTAVGFCTQRYDVFVATGLTQGDTEREPGELDMVCRWWSLADVWALIASGELTDGHSVAALALFDQHRRAGG